MRHPVSKDRPASLRDGFTLAELLISLAIIAAILLGGFLVHLKVDQIALEARATQWVSHVGSGLRSFSNDHGGACPDVAHDPSHALLRQGVDRNAQPAKPGQDTATDNFSAVIGGGYFMTETAYHLDGECYATGRRCPPPDRDIYTPILPENIAWSYVRGLNSRSADAGTPLVMSRNESSGSGLRWPREPGRVGGVLSGKIVVAFMDGSARLITLSENGVARDAQGRDITSPAPGSPYPDGQQTRIIQP